MLPCSREKTNSSPLRHSDSWEFYPKNSWSPGVLAAKNSSQGHRLQPPIMFSGFGHRGKTQRATRMKTKLWQVVLWVGLGGMLAVSSGCDNRHEEDAANAGAINS